MTQWRLDLGSGVTPREGFTGVDRIQAPGVVTFDLASGARWPFEDGSASELHSSHFIEHLPATELETPHGPCDAFVWFMEEAWRVAAPAAHFTLRWPAVQRADTGEFVSTAFLDPTHRRFIPIEQIPLYFDARRRLSNHSGTHADWRPASVRQGEIGRCAAFYGEPETLVLVENELVLVRGSG